MAHEARSAMSPAAIPADSSTSAGSPVPTPLIPEAGPYFEGDERANGERMLADDWCVTAGPDSARIAAHARKALYEFDRSFARGWKTRPKSHLGLFLILGNQFVQ